MSLREFDNLTGEGIVGFDPPRTRGPEHAADHSLWYAGLTVDGTRVFRYGCPCGTCGITFKKVASPKDRVRDREAVELLEDLRAVPSDPVLRRLARILPPGVYHPFIVETVVQSITPGDPDDYFAREVVSRFGLEPPDYVHPEDPGTSYYRLARDFVLARFGRRSGTYDALLSSIAMPLQDPARLDRSRVEEWKARALDGEVLTAFAVSVLDVQAPAVERGHPDFPFEELMLLTHCLLDGHHRIRAASELGLPIRILTFLSREGSRIIKDGDLEVAAGRFAVPGS